VSSNKLFNRLSVRLTAGFLLAAVIGVAVVAILAYRATSNDFRSYISDIEAMQRMMGGTGGMMGDSWTGNSWMGMTSQPALDFVSNLGRTLWIAGLVGVLLAIILGGLFARYIVAPLGEVTVAARRVAGGDFLQSVKARGSSELTELGESFNKMAETLKRDRDLRQNIVADIAHELRTPLSVLQANIEAMQDGVMENNPESLESLHQETVTLARLIEDLRTLSLAESGQLKFNLKATDMKELAPKVVDGMQTQFAARRISMSLEAPEILTPVSADPDRIEQVLRNLLTNALHYTPEGGRVAVKLDPDGDGLTVSVTDTGIGISPDDLPRLFDRFYRVDRSRTRSTGGTGLGLAIVKQLVEAHGGRVWATSEVGKGSTFFFHLPTSR
jgi:two-component system, OmpR family, sensor histidine kinase BaeS